MTIAEMVGRGKEGLSRISPDMLIILVIVLTASASFGLGILVGRDMDEGREDDRIWIERLEAEAATPAAAVSALPANPVPAPVSTTGKYLASKNGEKYYLPTCSGAKRIKEENKIWFASVEEATIAGYEPAANCPGL
jgi:hypothetical protein